MSLRPQHPALHGAHRAIHSLRTLAATSPQDAALLILGIAGDGTGEPSLIGELTTILVALAQQGARHLPPQAAEAAVFAARTAEVVIDQQAGDHLARALNLLEQHRDLPTPANTHTAAPAAAAAGLTLAGAR